MTRREKVLALVVLLSGLALLRDPLTRAGSAWWYRATPTRETVVFVVLDTVRADHLSLCGYDRPTSPTLDGLRDQGASVSCRAYAPGSWTYPSHASYFTGLPPAEHGSHFVTADAPDHRNIRELILRPLDRGLPTLAERFAERGYQTVGLAANPVLAPASGLDRGHERWGAASQFGPWYRHKFIEQLDLTLRALDPDRPLYLFLNIADAHDPWFGVPEGVPWLPAHDRVLAYFETDENGKIEADGPWQRYVRGELSEAEAAAYRRELRDLYDYGVFQADRTLGLALERLRAHGWDRAGLRLVITADHGEFLGEHGLLNHGRYLYEGNNRVPLVTLGTGPLPQERPLSALDVHGLVLNGHLPEGGPVTAASWPDPTWQAQSGGVVGGALSVALWEGRWKWLWMDGVVRRFDVLEDPGELHVEVGAEEAPAALSELAAAARASAARSFETSPELIEALRSAGYVE